MTGSPRGSTLWERGGVSRTVVRRRGRGSSRRLDSQAEYSEGGVSGFWHWLCNRLPQTVWLGHQKVSRHSYRGRTSRIELSAGPSSLLVSPGAGGAGCPWCCLAWGASPCLPPSPHGLLPVARCLSLVRSPVAWDQGPPCCSVTSSQLITSADRLFPRRVAFRGSGKNIHFKGTQYSWFGELV